jgi:hypothetical protein
MTAKRPRFSPDLQPVELHLPPGRQLGGVVAAKHAPDGSLLVLHQPGVPGDARDPHDIRYLGDVARFAPDGHFIASWGGPFHAPAIVDGVSQWPNWSEGLEVDAAGDIWIFGFLPGDNAVLRFAPDGALKLRLGAKGEAGGDADTRFLDRPTSCHHDVAGGEVFIADGYGNHRIIAFASATGAFTRLWGAYGEAPGAGGRNFGNPVHKIAANPHCKRPDGRLYVCDRINNRIQEFEPVPGGARFLREVEVAPGTRLFGSTFDMGFSPCGRYILVCDGSNIRIWVVDLDTFEVLGWSAPHLPTEGEANRPGTYGMFHRFTVEPSGDLLLSSTTRGLSRMKYLGID